MNKMVVEVIDWNLRMRYYQVATSDLKILMAGPRSERKKMFRTISTPTRVHCESEADIFLPIYTDDDWDEHEEIFREYIK